VGARPALRRSARTARAPGLGHPAALPQLVGQRQLAPALVDEEERLHQVHAGRERAGQVRMIELGRGSPGARSARICGPSPDRERTAQELHHHRMACARPPEPRVREPTRAQLVQQPESRHFGCCSGELAPGERAPAPIADGLTSTTGLNGARSARTSSSRRSCGPACSLRRRYATGPRSQDRGRTHVNAGLAPFVPHAAPP